jgi:hypothetical protein
LRSDHKQRDGSNTKDEAYLQDAQSVLIEINDEFRQQAEDATRYLSAAGLQLNEKYRWKGTDNSPFESTYNQIWHRDVGLTLSSREVILPIQGGSL